MNNLVLAILLESAITVLALVGFGLASYIHVHKKARQKLVCPLRSNCETVIHSDYSKFLGVPVEALGMIYYVLAASFHFLLIALPAIVSPSVLLFTLVISTAAFLFSLYLLSIQFFIIKQLCTWCIISAIISTLIFLLTFISSHVTFGPLLGY
jgi:uncharacterized membrane protein